MYHASNIVEFRTLGNQPFELHTWVYQKELSLFHLNAAGSRLCYLGNFAEPASAWPAADHHAYLIAITGRCDGLILLQPDPPVGRVHKGHLQGQRTRCGIRLAQPAANYRIPGDTKDWRAVSCRRCQLA
jgi:hypothetical protein